MKSHLLIGAAASGSGKTTFTLGLLRALRACGLNVQPFKCGPDYIDPIHHRMAAGRPSINLDLFLMSPAHVSSLYSRYTARVDVAVTEGVMGLFDGYDGRRGSSAEIALQLQIPVILVVNAKSMAYSAAPLLYGFRHFDRRVRLAGVVFNFVASERHYSFLRQAAEDAGIEPLGYLPAEAGVEIPGRYLGLSLDEACCFDAFADRIARLVEKHIRLDHLLRLTAAPSLPSFAPPPPPPPLRLPGAGRIAIARDKAFNFMYEENLRFLHRSPQPPRYFSPLSDARLPEADFVYLPGGYPELYLPELGANTSMLASIRAHVDRGGKMLAECGGMMYLAESITGANGQSHPMAGVLGLSVTLEHKKLHLGYRQLHLDGHVVRGHEFHYSALVPWHPALPSVAEAFTADGRRTDTPLYRHQNLLAGYTHLYWADETQNEWFVEFLTH
jgi:cobyrinic acid a,c-diamide synthase